VFAPRCRLVIAFCIGGGTCSAAPSPTTAPPIACVLEIGIAGVGSTVVLAANPRPALRGRSLVARIGIAGRRTTRRVVLRSTIGATTAPTTTTARPLARSLVVVAIGRARRLRLVAIVRRVARRLSAAPPPRTRLLAAIRA